MPVDPGESNVAPGPAGDPIRDAYPVTPRSRDAGFLEGLVDDLGRRGLRSGTIA
jgi:hypothetical protein